MRAFTDPSTPKSRSRLARPMRAIWMKERGRYPILPRFRFMDIPEPSRPDISSSRRARNSSSPGQLSGGSAIGEGSAWYINSANRALCPTVSAEM